MTGQRAWIGESFSTRTEAVRFTSAGGKHNESATCEYNIEGITYWTLAICVSKFVFCDVFSLHIGYAHFQ
jgi:hypothetical protein